MLTSVIADGFHVPDDAATAYERFWPEFMAVHMHPRTRQLHGVATALGLIALALFLMTFNAAWLLLGAGVAYPLAWYSHAVYERALPKAFTNPYWALLCDLDMLALLAAGLLDQDLERIRAHPNSSSGPWRRTWHLMMEIAAGSCLLGFGYLAITGQVILGWP